LDKHLFSLAAWLFRSAKAAALRRRLISPCRRRSSRLSKVVYQEKMRLFLLEAVRSFFSGLGAPMSKRLSLVSKPFRLEFESLVVELRGLSCRRKGRSPSNLAAPISLSVEGAIFSDGFGRFSELVIMVCWALDRRGVSTSCRKHPRASACRRTSPRGGAR
jgi:hypothetical protein